MESANVQALYAEWQGAVVAYAGLVRDGKMRGLTKEEIEELEGAYTLRIDVAYARLKQAEAARAMSAAS